MKQLSIAITVFKAPRCVEARVIKAQSGLSGFDR